MFQQTSWFFVWFFHVFPLYLQWHFSSPTDLEFLRLVLVFSFLWAFPGVKNSNLKAKFSRSSSSAGLLVAMFSLFFAEDFPRFWMPNVEALVTRGENFFSRYCLLTSSACTMGIKHARAIEFELCYKIRSLLAGGLILGVSSQPIR